MDHNLLQQLKWEKVIRMIQGVIQQVVQMVVIILGQYHQLTVEKALLYILLLNVQYVEIMNVISQKREQPVQRIVYMNEMMR
jgi:hypothetical protein